MRIGLYGLPTSGKTYLMNALTSMRTVSGSNMLLQIHPGFHSLDELGKKMVRMQLAETMSKEDHFIMDGHYSFGDNVVFLECDGEMYDVILYLYVDPTILKARMELSDRNKKYLSYDIKLWQENEVEALREYCHLHNKDFYVLDNPETGFFDNTKLPIDFINSILDGFSCYQYACKCSEEILGLSKEQTITLLDGDKTITVRDTSVMLGYQTKIFDGNFYTGFQSWRHTKEFSVFLESIRFEQQLLDGIQLQYNTRVLDMCTHNQFILTSGYRMIWNKIASELGVPMFCGEQMAADTKYFVVKKLQEESQKVIAFGDSMNDYYMIAQADEGYLVTKTDGSVSRSLTNRNTERFSYV